ncbi:MAG: DNA-binding response regulator, partial [[Clostridium] innocuum]
HILSRKEFQSALSQQIFEPYKKGFQMAYFRVDNINHLYQTKLKDHAALHKHLQDLIRESMPLAVHHHLIFMSNHSGILMFDSREKLRILNLCNSIIRNITQYLNIHMSITLSDVIPTLDEFYDQFELLLKSHERRFYAGEGSLIQSEEYDAFQELDMNEVKFHLELLEAVRGKDFDTVHQKLKETLEYMRTHDIEPHAVIEYFIFVFHNIEGNEMERGIRQAFPFDTITAKLQLCETADKLEEIAQDSFDKIEAWMNDRASEQYRKEILDAMEYINANMNRKVTLKRLRIALV